MRKKIILLLILLLSIFMLGAVSAVSDDNVASSSKVTNSISVDSDTGDVDISNVKNSEVKDTNNILKSDNSKNLVSKNNNPVQREITGSSKTETYKDSDDDLDDDDTDDDYNDDDLDDDDLDDDDLDDDDLDDDDLDDDGYDDDYLDDDDYDDDDDLDDDYIDDDDLDDDDDYIDDDTDGDETVHNAYIKSKNVYYNTNNQIKFGWKGNFEGYFKIYKGKKQIYSHYLKGSNKKYKYNPKILKVGSYTTKLISNGKTIAQGKIVVNKAKTKIYAKEKTFNVKTKVKNYAIILKNNQNNVMKNKLVTLKVNGKTYKAKTNNKGQAIFKINKLNKKGTYAAIINYQGDKNYNKSTLKVKITVNKENTKITTTPLKLTTTYNINKKLIITLKDRQNKPITNTQITVKIGNNTKKYKTNKKGQITISTKKLTPKTYTTKIVFNGNNYYLNSSTTSKITIQKATPKITAKSETFKEDLEIKKYTITLNNNLKKPMKQENITLNIEGKKYKAQTNKKGIATFTINNLNTKGTYTATITYKGDKNYKKTTKKIKITIK